MFVYSVGQSLARFPGVGPTTTQPGWTKGILLVWASGIGVLLDTLPVVITPSTTMAQCVTFPVVMTQVLVALVILVQETDILGGEPSL